VSIGERRWRLRKFHTAIIKKINDKNSTFVLEKSEFIYDLGLGFLAGMLSLKKNFLFVGALIALVLFFSGGLAAPVRDFVISRTAFVSSFFARGGFIAAKFIGRGDVSDNERIRLFVDAAEIDVLRKENETLRTALRIESVAQKKVLPAFISGIGREIGDEYVWIDKGVDDGIGLDFLVFGDESVLLGRTVEVFSRASRVRLFSSPREIVEVLILPSGIRAVSRGAQSGELSLDLVPRESDIKIGDVVVTSERSVYGKNRVIGEVVDIRASDTDVFQKVSARHLFDSFSASVFIVAPQ
jgi:cell shape-determining protein MreC